MTASGWRRCARQVRSTRAREEGLDRLTRLAANLLSVPVSLICLVDEQRQFFKSQIGLQEPRASARETPLSHSICQHLVYSGRAIAPSATYASFP